MVEGTPDCTSLGELVDDEGYDHIWTRRTVPVLIESEARQTWFPEDKAIYCTDRENACYLPEGGERQNAASI